MCVCVCVCECVHTAAERGLRPHHLRWSDRINRTKLFSRLTQTETVIKKLDKNK